MKWRVSSFARRCNNLWEDGSVWSPKDKMQLHLFKRDLDLLSWSLVKVQLFHEYQTIFLWRRVDTEIAKHLSALKSHPAQIHKFCSAYLSLSFFFFNLAIFSLVYYISIQKILILWCIFIIWIICSITGRKKWSIPAVIHHYMKCREKHN